MDRTEGQRRAETNRGEVPPRVSVICNFYDAEDYLAEAVESVLAQDYRDFELLLVDDGATDSSSTIARDFVARHPERIRYLHHPDRLNRGRSASRNLGLMHAQGEFVAFIDADDRWTPNKLSEQLDVFASVAGIDAVCGSVNYWRSWNGGSDRIVPTGHVANGPVRPPDALLHWYPLGKAHAPSISDLLMRIAAVRAVDGFEDDFPSAYDDQAFLAKFYMSSAIYVSTVVWSDYRLHDRSCMARVVSEGRYHEFRSQFLEWFAIYLRNNPATRPEVAAALNKALRPYRHPHIARPLRFASKVLRKLGA